MNFDSMTLEEIWREIDIRANKRPDLIEDFHASYSFKITGEDSGQYGLIFKESRAQVIKGGLDDADCSMTMSLEHFKKLLLGNLNATTAYMTGRLKVKGNLGLGLKLESLLKKFPID